MRGQCLESVRGELLGMVTDFRWKVKYFPIKSRPRPLSRASWAERLGCLPESYVALRSATDGIGLRE